MGEACEGSSGHSGEGIGCRQGHDKDGLLDVGEALDSACESCHVVYWYPDEKKPK